MILKKPHQSTPVHLPPLISDSSPVNGDGAYSNILSAAVNNRPLSAVKPYPVHISSFSSFDGMSFTPPPYPSHHLQQINNLLIKSKSQEGLLLEDIRTTFTSRDEQVYSSYVAYCEKMKFKDVPDERYPWAGPHTIEHWDSLRDAQTLTAPTVEPPYKVDAFVPLEKQAAAHRLSQAKHPHRFVTRAVVVDEDFSGYVWQNRTKTIQLEVRGRMLVNVAKPLPIDVACLRRGIEHPITFDKHLARAALCPALEEVNEYELTAAMVQKRTFGYWAPFEYRPTIKVKATGAPATSLWCKTCVTHTELTKVDGLKVVLEQRGVFVELTTVDEAGSVRPHTCAAPTLGNDSISLGRLWSWLNHRTWKWNFLNYIPRTLKSARLWAFAHPTVEGDEPTQLAVPIVTRPLPARDGMPVCLSWSFTDKCTHRRLRMTCKVCNAAHIAHCAEVADHLPVPRCTHVEQLSFRFTDDNTITLCACGKTTGHDVLLLENIFQPNKEMLGFYDLVLARFGLSSYGGLHKEHLSYYAPSTLLTMHHTIVKEILIGGRRLNLHSWAEKADRKEGNDSSVRDERANDIVKQSRPDKKAKTRDVRVARWCLYSQCPRKGEPFIDRPNKKYCSDNCRKRHNEMQTA